MHIGPKMLEAVEVVKANPHCTKKYVAERIGPHGSVSYGYRPVDRAIKAGLIVAHVYPNGVYSLHV